MSDKYIRLDDALEAVGRNVLGSETAVAAIATLPAVDVAGVRADALHQAAEAMEAWWDDPSDMRRPSAVILALIDTPAPAPDKVARLVEAVRCGRYFLAGEATREQFDRVSLAALKGGDA